MDHDTKNSASDDRDGENRDHAIIDLSDEHSDNSLVLPKLETWYPLEPLREVRYRSSRQTAILAIAILVGIIGSIYGFFLIFGYQAHPLLGSLTAAASWLLALIVWLAFTVWSRGKLEIKSGDELAPDERNANQQLLARYQYLTQRQATSSYRLAQLAILAGLLILLGGVAITVKTSGTTTQLVVGGLSALGSTISAYVGATSIRVYNRTLSQMNFYYAQPLVQSYVLQAEKLSEMLSPHRKDVALEDIIAQTLEGASVAAHLIAQGGDTQRSSPLWQRNRRSNKANANSSENRASAKGRGSKSAPKRQNAGSSA